MATQQVIIRCRECDKKLCNKCLILGDEDDEGNTIDFMCHECDWKTMTCENCDGDGRPSTYEEGVKTKDEVMECYECEMPLCDDCALDDGYEPAIEEYITVYLCRRCDAKKYPCNECDGEGDFFSGQLGQVGQAFLAIPVIKNIF